MNRNYRLQGFSYFKIKKIFCEIIIKLKVKINFGASKVRQHSLTLSKDLHKIEVKILRKL